MYFHHLPRFYQRQRVAVTSKVVLVCGRNVTIVYDIITIDALLFCILANSPLLIKEANVPDDWLRQGEQVCRAVYASSSSAAVKRSRT